MFISLNISNNYTLWIIIIYHIFTILFVCYFPVHETLHRMTIIAFIWIKIFVTIIIDLHWRTNVKHLHQHVKNISCQQKCITYSRYMSIKSHIYRFIEQHWILKSWWPFRWNMNAMFPYSTFLNCTTYVKVTHDTPFMDKQC